MNPFDLSATSTPRLLASGAVASIADLTDRLSRVLYRTARKIAGV